nr:hypothetical protein [Candidatus Electrothrix aestuarii]
MLFVRIRQLHDMGQAEIQELDFRLLCCSIHNKNIARFYISVNNIVGVDAVQCFSNFSNKGKSLIGCELNSFSE